MLKLSYLFGVSTDYLLKDSCQEQHAEQPDTVTLPAKKRVSALSIIGGVASALSLLGLLVLGIVGSVKGKGYTIDVPVEAPAGITESEIACGGTIKQGFAAYLEIEHLEWLFWLLIACAAVGLLTALTPAIRRFIQRKRLRVNRIKKGEH